VFHFLWIPGELNLVFFDYSFSEPIGAIVTMSELNTEKTLDEKKYLLG
jgi:hypothetical protein